MLHSLTVYKFLNCSFSKQIVKRFTIQDAPFALFNKRIAPILWESRLSAEPWTNEVVLSSDHKGILFEPIYWNLVSNNGLNLFFLFYFKQLAVKTREGLRQNNNPMPPILIRGTLSQTGDVPLII